MKKALDEGTLDAKYATFAASSTPLTWAKQQSDRLDLKTAHIANHSRAPNHVE
jgi:hypothetical protein